MHSFLTRLLAILLLAAAASPASSQTYYWGGGSVNIPGNGTGASIGGTGNWNTTASNWDTGAGLPYGPWVNATNLTANFGGTAGTITLDENITVGGLQFFTTGYNFTTGANTLSFGAAENLISFRNIAAATITGSVGGTGNVTFTALRPTTAGTFTFNGTSTGGWSGTTTVNNAMTLSLTQSSQVLLNTTGITLNGGNITLTNTTAAEALLDRVSNSAAITANGGTFTLANTSGANVYAETIGSVALTSGLTTFLFSLNQASTGSQTLTLSGLTRTGATNTSAVNFLSNSGLNTTKNIIAVTGATATTAGQIIGPWAYTGNTAGAGDYAIYNAASQVLPAGATLVAGGEATWTVATDAYNNNVVTQTLTATRTITALRTTAATATLTVATGANLETFGLLNGTAANTLFTVAATGTGVLTTPTGGGAIHVNAGNVSSAGGPITISAPIADNGGAVSVVKNGLGTLVLSSTTSSFTGNLVINAGTITASVATNIGGAAPIIFNGSAVFNAGSVTYARGITINNGAMITFGNANSTFSGNLTGTGGVIANNGFGTQIFFTGTANTFEGPIVLGLAGGTTGQAYRFSAASFADSATANGRILFAANSVTHADGSVFEYTGTANLAINNRQFELASTTATPVNGHQIRSNGTGTLTINTPLFVSTSPAQLLSLGGSNTTANAITSNISNGSSTAVSLTKAGAGLWVLSGTNTYTGVTTMGFNNPASTGLYFQGLQALPPTTTLRQTHPGGVGGFGTFRLLDDAASPVSRAGVNLSLIASNTSNGMAVFVGNNGVANGGNGAGGTTGSTIILGNIGFIQSVAGNTSQTLNVSGANSYRLQLNNVVLPALVAASTTWNGVFNPGSAPLTITGTVQQTAGSAAGTLTLTLDGGATGNILSGNILNSLDVTPRPLNVTKSNSGSWTLSGNNTFTGALTLSGASVGSRLNIGSATALGLGTFVISGGDNGSFDNSTGATLVNANNNPMTWSNNFTFVGSNSLDLGNGAVAMGGNRTITVSGAGTLTVGGVISGAGFGITLAGAGTLSLTGASTFTGALGIGNNVANTLRLQANSIANLGSPSALGAPTTATTGLIRIGSQSNTSTLEFINLVADQTTDRQVQIGSSSNGSGSATILNNSSFAVSFTNTAFNVAATGITSTNRGLNLGGTNTGNNTIAGAIINNVGTAPFGLVSLNKSGTGTWLVTGTNTYTAGTGVTGGTLTFGTNGTPGATTGALTVNNPNTGPGTDVIVNLATAIDTTTGRLSGTIATPSSGVNTVTINTGGLLRVFTVNQTAAATYAGVIAGAGSFTLGNLSTNTLTLTGANTYTGGTVITAGSLSADTASPNSATGTAAVTVTGGTLRGVGNIAGAITLNGGTIAPGDATNAGVLTTASLPTLTTGGMTFNLAGGLANSSQLNITGAGTLDLGSVLTLTVSPFTGASDPASFTLIASTGSSVLGSFSTFAEGSTVFTNTGTGSTYKIFYGTFPGEPGNVVLAVSAVPEPAFLLAALGLGVLVRRRRGV